MESWDHLDFSVDIGNLFSSLKAAAVHEHDCDKLAIAPSPNKEALNLFFQDRTTVDTLINRLVELIELLRTNITSPMKRHRYVSPFLCYSFAFTVCTCFDFILIWSASAHFRPSVLRRKPIPLNFRFRREAEQSTSLSLNITFTAAVSDYSLDAVMEKTAQGEGSDCCWVWLLHTLSFFFNYFFIFLLAMYFSSHHFNSVFTVASRLGL